MNFVTIKKNYLIVPALVCSLISPFIAANPAARLAELPASPISPADQLMNDAHRQLEEIAIIFVTLSGIISTKQVTLANKPKVLTQIRSISSFIQSLRERKFADADIPLAYEFLHINNLIMSYAVQALDNNFATIEKTSLDQMVKSSPIPTHIDIQQTTQLLIKNQFKLAQLTKKIDNYGLRWYNYAYRKLDDYIISPCYRYSIPKRVLFAAGGIFFTSYMWRQINYESYTKYCPRMFRLGSNQPKSFHSVDGKEDSAQSKQEERDALLLEQIKLQNILLTRIITNDARSFQMDR